MFEDDKSHSNRIILQINLLHKSNQQIYSLEKCFNFVITFGSKTHYVCSVRQLNNLTKMIISYLSYSLLSSSHLASCSSRQLFPCRHVVTNTKSRVLCKWNNEFRVSDPIPWTYLKIEMNAMIKFINFCRCKIFYYNQRIALTNGPAQSTCIVDNKLNVVIAFEKWKV